MSAEKSCRVYATCMLSGSEECQDCMESRCTWKRGCGEGKGHIRFFPLLANDTLSLFFFVDDAAGSVAETATKQPGHEPAKVKQFLSPSGFNGTDINTWLSLFHGNSRDLSNA